MQIYMYESLKSSNYAQIVCVVLTGMGADGTKGIVNLETSKKIHVIAQDEVVIYGVWNAQGNRCYRTGKPGGLT